MSEPQEMIIACRPVVWADPAFEETPIYPGSVVVKCTICSQAVYLGPRQQEYEGTLKIYCFMCSLIRMAINDEGGAVVQLGNPYLPAKS